MRVLRANQLLKEHRVLRRDPRDQRSITGVETAIVLITFVAVPSVFAFAALSADSFSSDKAKESIPAGLAETRGSMELKDSGR